MRVGHGSMGVLCLVSETIAGTLQAILHMRVKKTGPSVRQRATAPGGRAPGARGGGVGIVQ
jgi:hypothetical protein